MKLKWMIAGMAVAFLAACNGDGEDWQGADYPVTPCSEIALSETVQDDAQAVTLSKTYLYAAGRLESYTMTQLIHATEPVELEARTRLHYAEGEAVATDDYGNTWTYQLNENGYAQSCLCQEGGGTQRSYTFGYHTDAEGRHLLESLTEVLDDGTEYASLHIDYTDMNALRIAHRVDGYEQEFILSADASEPVANPWALPDLFLSELYPLSLHQPAWYGKLLGDAYGQLYTTLEPTDNAESGERTTYSYQLDGEARPTACVQTTVSYGQTYTRRLDYRVE